jgi:hypothetical protein
VPADRRGVRLWVLTALIALTGGWMAFDGAHALLTGDFVTPRSGDHAGELGPWSHIPRAFGVDPRSTHVRLFFLGFGLAYLAALAAFLLRRTGAWAALAACAAVALLYLPIGTLASAGALGILFTLRPRGGASAPRSGRPS